MQYSLNTSQRMGLRCNKCYGKQHEQLPECECEEGTCVKCELGSDINSACESLEYAMRTAKNRSVSQVVR